MNISDKFCTKVFNIMVGVCQSDDIFDIDKIEPIKSITSSRNIFSLNPVIIEADPFLFVKGEILYLFYEEQRGNRGKGILKMVSTKDLINWTSPTIVLEEPFHLSYPNVFEYNGRIFMLPETGHNKDVRLYEMSDDLKSCSYYTTLVQGEDFVDSDIYTNDGINYLFTSVYNGGSDYELRLYVGSKDLQAWKLHPSSPISTDNACARCGGRIYKTDGELYRIAQDCSGAYGGGLNAYNIRTISQTKYSESFVRALLPIKKFPIGGHQFSSIEYKGKRIVAIDYLSNNFFIKDIIERILKKI